MKQVSSRPTLTEDLGPAEDNICQFTIIDFAKDISRVENLHTLPIDIRNEIESFQELSFRSAGFQELLGHSNGQLVLSMGGYWDHDFICSSYGSRSFQWNESEGLKLTPQVS